MIKNYINKSPENTLKNSENEKAWEDPLVGFISGDDPLYQEYKEYVGPFSLDSLWQQLSRNRGTSGRLNSYKLDFTANGSDKVR